VFLCQLRGLGPLALLSFFEPVHANAVSSTKANVDAVYNHIFSSVAIDPSAPPNFIFFCDGYYQPHKVFKMVSGVLQPSPEEDYFFHDNTAQAPLVAPQLQMAIAVLRGQYYRNSSRIFQTPQDSQSTIVLKIFLGPPSEPLLLASRYFARITFVKPPSSAIFSNEVYVILSGFRAVPRQDNDALLNALSHFYHNVVNYRRLSVRSLIVDMQDAISLVPGETRPTYDLTPLVGQNNLVFHIHRAYHAGNKTALDIFECLISDLPWLTEGLLYKTLHSLRFYDYCGFVGLNYVAPVGEYGPEHLVLPDAKGFDTYVGFLQAVVRMNPNHCRFTRICNWFFDCAASCKNGTPFSEVGNNDYATTWVMSDDKVVEFISLLDESSAAIFESCLRGYQVDKPSCGTSGPPGRGFPQPPFPLVQEPDVLLDLDPEINKKDIFDFIYSRPSGANVLQVISALRPGVKKDGAMVSSFNKALYDMVNDGVLYRVPGKGRPMFVCC